MRNFLDRVCLHRYGTERSVVRFLIFSSYLQAHSNHLITPSEPIHELPYGLTILQDRHSQSWQRMRLLSETSLHKRAVFS